jgi:hypothetical protein
VRRLLFAKLRRVVDQEVDHDIAGRGFEENAHGCLRAVQISEITSRSWTCYDIQIHTEG